MTTQKRPTNIVEIREQIIDAFCELRQDPKRMALTAELSNTAGKVIQTLKLETDYAMARGEKPEIPFLHGLSQEKVALPAKE